jgi:hypothetical protein
MNCPRCGSPMRRRSGRYGAFWGCSRYPSCRGTRRLSHRRRPERQPSSVKLTTIISAPRATTTADPGNSETSASTIGVIARSAGAPQRRALPSIGWMGAAFVGLILGWQGLIGPALGFVAPPDHQSGQRYGAICRDGWRSSATGSGACSHHGGVDHWLVYNDGATALPVGVATPTRVAATRTTTTVTYVAPARYGARCADGSFSNATGSGACSHHGGVSSWLSR